MIHDDVPAPRLYMTSTPPKPLCFIVAVDLGSVNDSTAISVVEIQQVNEVTEAYPVQGLPWEVSKKEHFHYIVRNLIRPRLGTSYPVIISQIAAIVGALPKFTQPNLLVLDGTGLGAPVVQSARQQGLKCISIAITAGQTASLHGKNWTVPKALLVGDLRLAMHQKTLHVAQGFAERETLATELAAFTARLSASGRASFEAAGSEHDDTVLSLAMAIFVAKNRPPVYDEAFFRRLADLRYNR